MSAAPRSRGRLALRLYAIGIAQLMLLLVSALAVERLMQPGPPAHDQVGLSLEQSVRLLDPVIDDAPERQRVLESLHERYGVELSLYDEDEHAIATTLDPPIRLPPDGRGHGPPPRGELDHFFDRGPPGPPPFGIGPPGSPHGPPPNVFSRSFDARGHAYTLALQLPPPFPRYVAGLATLLVGLLILGIGALFTARSIVEPLEQLARTAARVGAGDLRARTQLSRNDEIGDVARAIDSMAGDVDTLLRAERELLANVSHELRTPLARIRVAMDLAAEGDPGRARAAVTEIATDLAELEGLVDDILTAMRFEANGRNAPSAGLPLSTLEQTTTEEITERALDRFRTRHPDRPLEISIANDLPPIIVDKVLFRRVVDNVLENADKYSPDRALPIVFDVTAGPELVTIRVRDRGLGIRAEDLLHVFEPFYRGERSRSREAGGVGLGLTLAKRIVEAHGGTIHVESTVGVGTTVEIAVPAWRG
jgi:two-component system OmpR family sensor kinase